MSSEQAAQTARKWYQGKRVPLYVVVGGGIASAAYFLSSRTKHPLVEGNPDIRKDPVPQERPGAHEHGNSTHESIGRRATRSMGLHGQDDDPQGSHGILQNHKTKDLIEGTPLERKEKGPNKPKV